MDADIDGGAVGFFPLNALNVDDKLFAVHLHHLAHLLPLEVTTHHLPQTEGEPSPQLGNHHLSTHTLDCKGMISPLVSSGISLSYNKYNGKLMRTCSSKTTGTY